MAPVRQAGALAAPADGGQRQQESGGEELFARPRGAHERGVQLPGPVGARSALAVRVGAPIAEPTALEHFLTARWGLHYAPFGRPLYLPNEHPRWPLRRAELLDLDEDLAAAGLPAPTGPPVSVLYSPEVAVRFGGPT